MDFYLEYLSQPLLPYLSVKKLIMFTSCNKFLNSKSENLLEDKCKKLYDIDVPKYSWRYTLTLLKYGKRKIPIIMNLSDGGNNVILKCSSYTTVYACDPGTLPESYDNVIKTIDEYLMELIYFNSCFQLLEPNFKLIDNLEDYLLSNNGGCYYNKVGGPIFRISAPRKNCRRCYGLQKLNNKKYIGLSMLHDKTLFESITSVDVFMYKN